MMRMPQFLRALVQPRMRTVRRTAQTCRPKFELLESRVVPATNLILDFDGGVVPGSIPGLANYTFAGPANFNWKAYKAHNTTAAVPGDRNEQILAIVAGVRQAFADWNVNVV